MRPTWNEKRRSHFIGFETDSGFDLRSKIPGSARSDCSFELHGTDEDVSDLEAFYKNDCAEGSVGFTMTHWRKGTSETFMWAEAPQASHLGKNIYLIPISLIMD